MDSRKGVIDLCSMHLWDCHAAKLESLNYIPHVQPPQVVPVWGEGKVPPGPAAHGPNNPAVLGQVTVGSNSPYLLSATLGSPRGNSPNRAEYNTVNIQRQYESRR